MRDRLKRRWIPRLIVALSQVTWPARLRTALLRARGRPGRVELYFAFDDAASAVAVLDLAERLARRDVELDLRPVVARGVAGDPAADAKRRYAIADARRLARRHGWTLARDEPLPAAATAGLAARVAGLAPEERRAAGVALLRALWLGDGEAADPPGAPDDDALARNERAMRRRGPYDTPAAVVHGRWYFAHDRPAQIAAWLDELGWPAR